MKKIIIGFSLLFGMLCFLTGCDCQHEWIAATCQEPATCSICGATDGEPLSEHNVEKWQTRHEATCEAEGEAFGVCVDCGETVTKVLPIANHTAGDWQVTKEATASEAGTKVKLCTICGAQVETESIPSLAQEKENLEGDIKWSLEKIVRGNYTDTRIDHISLNENYGTNEDGDYVALVYLVWNVKNSSETTREMLAMYSEDFAARIGESIPEVSEVSVFWTVPYHSESNTAIKYSYERSGNGMYETDVMINI